MDRIEYNNNKPRMRCMKWNAWLHNEMIRDKRIEKDSHIEIQRMRWIWLDEQKEMHKTKCGKPYACKSMDRWIKLDE